MPTVSSEQSFFTTVSLMVIAAVAGAFALWYTRPVMVPFVLAIFISYLMSPLVDFLRVQWRVPKAAAVVIALLVASTFLFFVGVLIYTSTVSMLSNVGVYQDRIVNLVERFAAVLDRLQINLGQQQLVETVQQLPFFQWVRQGAGTAVGLLTNFVLVLIFVIYLLIGRHPYQLRTGIWAEIDQKIRHYILVKVATSAATGLLTGIILAAFGLELALVFGVMAFLLNFIPSVGSVIATLLPLPIALLQFDSTLAILAVVLLPGTVQFTIGNVIEPMIMGEGLDLHPVVVVMSLVFWGLLWGVTGMLLAAPITAVSRIVFARFRITRPLAAILSGRLPEKGLLASELLVPTQAD